MKEFDDYKARLLEAHRKQAMHDELVNKYKAEIYNLEKQASEAWREVEIAHRTLDKAISGA